MRWKKEQNILPCGICIIPTVSPATTSWSKFFLILYRRIILIKGNNSCIVLLAHALEHSIFGQHFRVSDIIDFACWETCNLSSIPFLSCFCEAFSIWTRNFLFWVLDKSASRSSRLILAIFFKIHLNLLCSMQKKSKFNLKKEIILNVGCTIILADQNSWDRKCSQTGAQLQLPITVQILKAKQKT